MLLSTVAQESGDSISVFSCKTLQFDTPNSKLFLVRLHPTDKRVRKAALDVHMVAMAVPREVIFLQPFRQFRRFGFQLFGHFQPMLARGDTVHAFLIERIRQNIGPGYAETCLC